MPSYKSFKDIPREKPESANPFYREAFLHGLETCQAVCPETGWQPMHLSDGSNWIPTYLKGHSYGEYLFDWDWAHLCERNQIPYYPKIISQIPFTPVTASKAPSGYFPSALKELMLETKVLSAHALFIPKEEISRFEKASFLTRRNFQFQWENRSYESFDHFLSFLKKRKRKSIKKERQEIIQQEIEIQVLTGGQILEHHASIMHDFYLKTIQKKNAIPYLSQSFFHYLFQNLKESLLFILATKEDTPIGAALNLFNQSTLYGRYYGGLEDYKDLHFELCYYQAIEFAIKNKLKRVEAGAQGPQKLARGFLPTEVYSAHLVNHSQLRQFISTYIAEEDKMVEQQMAYYSSLSPFKS